MPIDVFSKNVCRSGKNLIRFQWLRFFWWCKMFGFLFYLSKMGKIVFFFFLYGNMFVSRKSTSFRRQNIVRIEKQKKIFPPLQRIFFLPYFGTDSRRNSRTHLSVYCLSFYETQNAEIFGRKKQKTQLPLRFIVLRTPHIERKRERGRTIARQWETNASERYVCLYIYIIFALEALSWFDAYVINEQRERERLIAPRLNDR